ncbi:MAG: ATP-dependent zinc protease [Bacteroidota bacterium]
MMKKTIGRIDKADFPELELENIPIKIDTGAYTSSIHCENFRIENQILYADFISGNTKKKQLKTVHFEEYNQIQVRSSNGVLQNRYEVKTIIKLFGKKYKISLSLADRNKMKNPVLIGRKFLNKKFIVDTELKDISYNMKANEY